MASSPEAPMGAGVAAARSADERTSSGQPREPARHAQDRPSHDEPAPASPGGPRSAPNSLEAEPQARHLQIDGQNVAQLVYSKRRNGTTLQVDLRAQNEAGKTFAAYKALDPQALEQAIGLENAGKIVQAKSRGGTLGAEQLVATSAEVGHRAASDAARSAAPATALEPSRPARDDSAEPGTWRSPGQGQAAVQAASDRLAATVRSQLRENTGYETPPTGSQEHTDTSAQRRIDQRWSQYCVFRPNVTGDFGIVTGHSGRM
ncbi:MAG: hypothetical protein RLY71_4039 [Pseudomonadota bacterium]